MTAPVLAPASRSPRRFAEQALVPALLLLAFVLPAVLWADRFPDPIASHWGPGGAPDGALPLTTALWLMASIWVAFWVGLLVLLRVRQVGGTEARVLVAVVYWAGTLLALVWLLGLRANLDVATWEQARDLAPWQPFAAMIAAVPVGLLGWWLASDRPATPSPAGEPVEPHLPPTGATAVWTGTATNPPIAAVAVAPFLVALVVALVVESAWTALAISAGVAVVVGSIASRVRVVVGPAGVRIVMGWLGWPRRRLGHDEITEVRVEDVVPLRYGGWGFRLLPGAQAHVVRRGPGIRLVREGRSDVVVTVDDAEVGAAVIAGHLAERRPA